MVAAPGEGIGWHLLKVSLSGRYEGIESSEKGHVAVGRGQAVGHWKQRWQRTPPFPSWVDASDKDMQGPKCPHVRARGQLCTGAGRCVTTVHAQRESGAALAREDRWLLPARGWTVRTRDANCRGQFEHVVSSA